MNAPPIRLKDFFILVLTLRDVMLGNLRATHDRREKPDNVHTDEQPSYSCVTISCTLIQILSPASTSQRQSSPPTRTYFHAPFGEDTGAKMGA
jgi:hypothetical protein